MQNHYIDEYGLVHPKAHIPSENGILFRAQLDLLTSIQGKDFYQGWAVAIGSTIRDDKENWFQANPPQKGPHFSRDNMTGLYAMFVIHGLEGLNLLPTFKWNGRIWWHPNGWAVFLSYKNKFWRFVLYPLIILMAGYSLLSKEKEETSGKCLWFLILSTLGKNYFWLIDLAEQAWLKKLEGESIFFWSYEYYFSGAYEFDNWDQPILQEIKEVF